MGGTVRRSVAGGIVVGSLAFVAACFATIDESLLDPRAPLEAGAPVEEAAAPPAPEVDAGIPDADAAAVPDGCVSRTLAWAKGNASCEALLSPSLAAGESRVVLDSVPDKTGKVTVRCEPDGGLQLAGVECTSPVKLQVGNDCNAARCAGLVNCTSEPPKPSKGADMATLLCKQRGFTVHTGFSSSSALEGARVCWPDGTNCFDVTDPGCVEVLDTVTCRY